MAEALVLAAISDRAARRIYNYAGTPAYSELEWTLKIASATAWNGRVITLPRERMPAHLVQAGNAAQHWEADSTRIREELGYRERVGIEESIRRTIEWERATPPGGMDLHRFDYAAEDAARAACG